MLKGTPMLAMMITMASMPAPDSEQPEVPPATAVSITYLANEGVFISDGSRGVLIDALFREGVPGYAALAPEVLEGVETARPPFDTTSLILVTHRHRDHFDPASTARHLANNPRAKLVTSRQVMERVKAAAADFDTIQPRIEAFASRAGTLYETDHDSIKVEAFYVSHGSGRFADIQNLGFIVTIGGTRIAHLGDAELDDGAFDPVRKFAQNIDVACVPYWWLITRTGREFVTDALPGVHLVAIHIEPEKAAAVTERIHKFLPDATVFTQADHRVSP
jgi:L-ascorbate metabolism protein UlaG (beta-lactamase superfamily)